MVDLKSCHAGGMRARRHDASIPQHAEIGIKRPEFVMSFWLAGAEAGHFASHSRSPGAGLITVAVALSLLGRGLRLEAPLVCTRQETLRRHTPAASLAIRFSVGTLKRVGFRSMLYYHDNKEPPKRVLAIISAPVSVRGFLKELRFQFSG